MAGTMFYENRAHTSGGLQVSTEVRERLELSEWRLRAQARLDAALQDAAIAPSSDDGLEVKKDCRPGEAQ